MGKSTRTVNVEDSSNPFDQYEARQKKAVGAPDTKSDKHKGTFEDYEDRMKKAVGAPADGEVSNNPFDNYYQKKSPAGPASNDGTTGTSPSSSELPSSVPSIDGQDTTKPIEAAPDTAKRSTYTPYSPDSVAASQPPPAQPPVPGETDQPPVAGEGYDDLLHPFAKISQKVQSGIVKVKSDKLRRDIDAGNEIDPALVNFVKQNDPATYSAIAKDVLPIKTDKYINSPSGTNNLVGTLNDVYQGRELKSMLDNFKKETGEQYSPEAAAKLSATERIRLRVPEPGDVEKATKETIQSDLDTNYPIVDKGPFNLVPVAEQHKIRQDILNDPEKQSEYLLNRQFVEMDGQKAINDKLVNSYNVFTASGMGGGFNEKFNEESYAKNEAARDKLLGQARTLADKISGLKSLAENAVSGKVISDYLAKNGINTATQQGKEQAVDLLGTKSAREAIGFQIALKSDATFTGNEQDVATSLQDESNAKSVYDADKPIATDDASRFKNLSVTGDEKIQAQLRLSGHKYIEQYFSNQQDNNALQKLAAKNSEIAIENGAAVSDELWARLSSARFKDNDNSPTFGLRDVTPENIRKWADEAGFTDVQKAILPRMIENEFSRTFTTNLQTGGFGNKAVEGFAGVFGSMGKIFRGDAARVRELLNENAGAMDDIGQYSPFLQELAELQQKEKKGALSDADQQRKDMLVSNTNLLTWYQKFAGGTGALTGQVVGQAVAAGAFGIVGNALARVGSLALKAGQLGAEAVGTALGGAAKVGATAAEGISAAGGAATGAEGAVAGLNAAMDNAGAAIGENVFSGPSTLSKVGEYARENANLYISSYVNAYDGYKKEALQLMPGTGNELNRTLYAGMMATVEGLSEKIFDDRKVLNAFGKEISPAVREIIHDMSSGALSKLAAAGKLQKVLARVLGGNNYKMFGKTFRENLMDEAWEEAFTDLTGDIGRAVVLGQNYDMLSSVSGAFKTYTSMITDGTLVAAMAARTDIRNNTFHRTTLYHAANSPQEYKEEINRLFMNGEITREQKDDKMLILNTAANAYTNMVRDKVVDKNGKDDVKNAVYLLHTVNEAIQNENAARSTDAVPKEKYLKSAQRSKKIRSAIYDGMVNVDEFMNPYTNNPALAQDLDIDEAPAAAAPAAPAPEGKRKNADRYYDQDEDFPNANAYRPTNAFGLRKDNFANAEKDIREGDIISVSGYNKKTKDDYYIRGTYNNGTVSTENDGDFTLQELKDKYHSDKPTIFLRSSNSIQNEESSNNQSSPGSQKSGTESGTGENGKSSESGATGTANDATDATDATKTNQADESGDGGVLGVGENGAADNSAAPLTEEEPVKPGRKKAEPVKTATDDNKKQALRDLMAATGEELYVAGTQDGTFAGNGLLNLDADGNVVLTRYADNEDGLTKGKGKTENLADIAGQFGGEQIATSGVEGGEGSFKNKVKGEYSIPLEDLKGLLKSGEVVFAGLGNREFVLSPHIADKYLSKVNDKPVLKSKSDATKNSTEGSQQAGDQQSGEPKHSPADGGQQKQAGEGQAAARPDSSDSPASSQQEPGQEKEVNLAATQKQLEEKRDADLKKIGTPVLSLPTIPTNHQSLKKPTGDQVTVTTKGGRSTARAETYQDKQDDIVDRMEILQELLNCLHNVKG